jgi:hypothetical protein
MGKMDTAVIKSPLERIHEKISFSSRGARAVWCTELIAGDACDR